MRVGVENLYVVVGDAMRIRPTDLFKPFFVDEKPTVQHIRCLVIVFRPDGCIIREIMPKVKFLFPAASHSFNLWHSLSFRLKQYNKPLKTAAKRYPIPPKPTSA